MKYELNCYNPEMGYSKLAVYSTREDAEAIAGSCRYCVITEITVENTALKYDDGKPDLTLVSKELMVKVAEVRQWAITKKEKPYPRDNWKKGFKVTRSLAAALRHIFDYLSGQKFDKESSLCNIAHAVCCLEHALYDLAHHPENDDVQAKAE